MESWAIKLKGIFASQDSEDPSLYVLCLLCNRPLKQAKSAEKNGPPEPITILHCSHMFHKCCVLDVGKVRSGGKPWCKFQCSICGNETPFKTIDEISHTPDKIKYLNRLKDNLIILNKPQSLLGNYGVQNSAMQLGTPSGIGCNVDQNRDISRVSVFRDSGTGSMSSKVIPTVVEQYLISKPESGIESESEWTRHDEKVKVVCCRSHKKKECSKYCVTCFIPICEDCLSNQHAGHKTGKNWIELNKETIPELRAFRQRQVKWLHQLFSLKEQQERSYGKIVQEINRTADFWRRKIDEEQCRLRSIIEEHFKKVEEHYNHGSEYIKYNLKYTESLEQYMDDTRGDSDHVVRQLNNMLFQLRYKIHRSEIEQEHKFVERLSKHKEFDQNDNMFEFNLGNYRDGRFNLPEYKESASPSPRLPSTSNELHECPQIQWQYEPIINLNTPNPKPSDVLLDNDNDSALVAFYGTNSVSRIIADPYIVNNRIIDPTFKLTWSASSQLNTPTKDIIIPRCLAKFDDDHFIITDSNIQSMRIFNNEGEEKNHYPNEILARFIPRGGNSIDQLLTIPHGIVRLPNGRLVVSDIGHHNVNILDAESLDLIKAFGKHDTKHRPLKKPNYLAYDRHHNRIAVSDYGNNCIRLYSCDGEYITSFGDPSSFPKSMQFPDGRQSSIFTGLKEPMGLKCNLNGDFIVNSGGVVSQWNRHGNFLSVIPIYDGPKKVTTIVPQGIDVNGQGQIVIAEMFHGKVLCVQAFK